MGADNLENNKMDEDALEMVNGGTRKVDNLVHRSTDKINSSKTLYSGEPRKAGNLLFKENKKKGNGKTELPLDDAKFC